MARNIVITGAGSGLGRAIARRLAGMGDRVVLLDRAAEAVEKVAAEVGGHAFGCDVSSPEAVRATFQAIGERVGAVDVLVNNAGIFAPFRIADATDEQITTTIAVNLTGPMLCVRAALPLMRRGGHIINISSESVVLPFPHLLVYQATKAGLERFSTGLEKELEGDGIRVTCIRAGQMMDEDSKPLAVEPEVARRFLEAAIANGLHLRERPISHYNSVTEVVVAALGMPADVHMALITLAAWKDAAP